MSEQELAEFLIKNKTTIKSDLVFEIAAFDQRFPDHITVVEVWYMRRREYITSLLISYIVRELNTSYIDIAGIIDYNFLKTIGFFIGNKGEIV